MPQIRHPAIGCRDRRDDSGTQVSRRRRPKEMSVENLAALEKGIANLERHVNNVRNHFGLPCVVAINKIAHDTDAEIALLKKKMAHHEAPVILATHFAEGGKGAEEVARAVVELIERVPADFRFVYDDAMPLWEKMKTVATKIYGASEVTADTDRSQIKKLQESGTDITDRAARPSIVFNRPNLEALRACMW